MNYTDYLKVDSANFYVLAYRVFIFPKHHFNDSFSNIAYLSFLKHINIVN